MTRRVQCRDIERRANRRFAIQAPVVFKMVEEQGCTVAGFTKDLSTSGVYICCAQSERPAVNKEVKVDILLPPLDREARSRMRVRATGWVTRLNSPGEASGFAVTASFGCEESA